MNRHHTSVKKTHFTTGETIQKIYNFFSFLYCYFGIILYLCSANKQSYYYGYIHEIV